MDQLETLFEADLGQSLPLPAALEAVYGSLRFPLTANRPYVIGNFVTSLDGVVALNAPGRKGGGDIAGPAPQDHMVMGVLRALADAIVVGAGTLRDSPGHVWTPEHVCREFSAAYQELRAGLGKDAAPLNVIVTASGHLDLTHPVFRTAGVPVLVVTTEEGARSLATAPVELQVPVAVAANGNSVSAQSVLKAIATVRSVDTVLCEGGPHLIGEFLAESRLDELFLTLSPQIAGRDETVERPGLVSGRLFAPAAPLWGSLVGVKKWDSHLFLRYLLPA